MLLFVGREDSSCPMPHLARGGDMRQAHKTARLLPLAGDHLCPLVQGDLQAIPQRFDYMGPRLAGPPRALLGALLDKHLHAVIDAL